MIHLDLEHVQEEITLPWLEYCINNCADHKVELAHNELITKIIPNANTQLVDGVNKSASTNDENENNK